MAIRIRILTQSELQEIGSRVDFSLSDGDGLATSREKRPADLIGAIGRVRSIPTFFMRAGQFGHLPTFDYHGERKQRPASAALRIFMLESLWKAPLAPVRFAVRGVDVDGWPILEFTAADCSAYYFALPQGASSLISLLSLPTQAASALTDARCSDLFSELLSKTENSLIDQATPNAGQDGERFRI